MPRAETEEVLQTFDADAEPEEVNQWLGMASDLVDDVEADAPSISESRLENIEILVAQHYLCAQYPRFSDQSGGERSASYGEGRSGTSYLDRAIRLDPTGNVRDSLTGQDVIFSA